MSNAIDRKVLKEMDIESLLDLSADQVSDIAELVPFPTVLVQLTVTKGEVDPGAESGKPFIAVSTEINDIIEWDDAVSEEEQGDHEIVGRTVSQRFYTGFGIESFKTTFTDLVQALEQANGQAPTIRDILENLEGTTWNALVEYKSNKNKDTGEVRYFNQINMHHCRLAGE